jgi:dolichol-phosphate mannosyltransferase
MQIGIVIPTYNEAGSLPHLLSALYALPLDLQLLVVDDNSPDGTGQLADELAAADRGRMAVLHRPQRAGLATACIQGFRYFLRINVDAIGQLDADLSHDPAVLVSMAKHLANWDVVLGSRYVRGGSVDGRWPLGRRVLSAWGNFYARHLLGLPFQDVTTGYRLWRRETIRAIPLERIRSGGYIFQVEMVYLAHRLQNKIFELPIHFAERQSGRTKMSLKIGFEAAWRVWRMPLAYRDVHCPEAPTRIHETTEDTATF